MKELEVTIKIRNNRIKERRLSMGLTQHQMAKLIGIGQQVLIKHHFTNSII